MATAVCRRRAKGGLAGQVGDEIREAKQVIVATGSRPRHLAVWRWITQFATTSARSNINAVPKKLANIGPPDWPRRGIWSRLGSR